MHELLSWLSDSTWLISGIAAVSMLLLALTLLAAPWAVSRLPSDYLLKQLAQPVPRSAGRLLLTGVRAMLGLIIVVLGLVMLVTPGPGVIMLLLGISIADFPGKHHLLIYLATRPNVLASLNWMRQRHGKAPFTHPHVAD
jgi:hypothetical protein